MSFAFVILQKLPFLHLRHLSLLASLKVSVCQHFELQWLRPMHLQPMQFELAYPPEICPYLNQLLNHHLLPQLELMYQIETFYYSYIVR